MHLIIKEHYPAEKLPEDLREGLDLAGTVRVTIEVELGAETASQQGRDEANWFEPPARVLTLEEIFALRQPPFRSAEEIDEELRRDRDSWDD